MPTHLAARLFAPLAAALALAFASCTQYPQDNFTGDAAALARLRTQPLDAAPWNFGDNPGSLISSDHYKIYTTIKDPLYLRLLPRVLEGAHARALEVNPSSDVKGPLDAYVFANRNQWETYTRLRAGSNAPIYLQITAGGYCQEGVFAGYDIGREQTLSVIAHEAWHQYSWFAFKDRLPSWLEEGLATQNEGIDWTNAEPHFVPEMNWRRYSALKAAIRENRLWKINDLVSTHAGQVIKMQQKTVDAYYAQLWSIVLFLENSKYRPGLLRLLADANAGRLAQSLAGTGVTQAEIANFTERWNTVAGPVYFRKYISTDVNQVQSEYEDWARHLTESWPPKLNH